MGWFSDVVNAVRARLGPNRPEAVPPGQPTSIDALVERMRAVDAGLAEGDGVRAFGEMYLRVTELVRNRLTEGYFTDAARMTRLDLVFAGLYLDAVSSPVPTNAWSPLFEARERPGVLSVQFAIAGMNAHINHDLPIAVVTTCRQLGTTPDAPGFLDDYERVTGLLETIQEQVRQSFFDGLALELDRTYAAPLANLLSSWSIARARDAAWTNAGVLWRLQGVEPLRTDFLLTLSKSVGMAGRCLLTPVTDLAP